MRIAGNRVTAGATLEDIMNKQTSTGRQAANEPSQPIALSEQELDNVVGGTKTTDHASTSLFLHCVNGKHIKSGNIIT